MAKKVKLIDSFLGEYRWLSNFYYAPIVYDGIKYSSTEVAYQAAKATNDSDKSKFVDLTSAKAKELGRKIDIRSDWDEIKDTVMY